MIVWGGRDAEGKWLGSGAVYNPEADSWKSISVEQCPIPSATLAATDGSVAGTTQSSADMNPLDPATILGTKTPDLPTIDEGTTRKEINKGINEAVKKGIGFYVNELVTPWSNAVWVDAVRKCTSLEVSPLIGCFYDPETDVWAAIGTPTF